MRKLFLSIFIISLVVLTLYSLNKSETVNPTPSQTLKPTTLSEQDHVDLSIGNENFKAAWIEVNDPSKISLIPNFKEKEAAFSIADKYGCKSLTNGGFYVQSTQDSSYSTQNSPIGLFVTDSKKIGEFNQNSLFNGFFKISKNEVPLITTEGTSDNFRIALQSGPILFKNGFPTKLSILDDKPGRRIVVAQGENKIYFIAFYNNNSVYLGPNLSDLPELLKMFAQKTKITIINALNLDGGAASAFHTDSFSLPELTPVGSFFCIKD